MHSVIAAISSTVPSVIMQYSHKAGGVMDMRDLTKAVWEVNDSSEKLFNIISTTLDQRRDVRAALEKQMPVVIAAAYPLGVILVEVIERHQVIKHANNDFKGYI
jgi:polysaccharide pyruvyl transferase WcaK-like protein